MNKHRRQLERCRIWLEITDTATREASGHTWTANETIAGREFPSIRYKALESAKRCERIKEYAFSRYRKAVSELELLCITKSF